MTRFRVTATALIGFAVILGGAALYDVVRPDSLPAAVPGPPATDGPDGADAATTGPLPSKDEAPTATAAAEPWPTAAPQLLPPREGPDPTSGFYHPGVLVSRPQLDVVRSHLRAGREPWTSAFQRTKRSTYADLDWRPRPWAVVECGYHSDPDHGCTTERRDAVAAYTHALLWYLTLDEAHAKKAIEIIDAWSAKLRRHVHDNGPLQAGWSGATFVRAAEIMRYTYAGWSATGIQQAEAMFRNVFLPRVQDGAPRGSEGNWDLIILDAAIGIAVFLDDRRIFDYAVQQWRDRLPAYIYLASDGSRPVEPPGGRASGKSLEAYWHGQATYVDGLAQETCRDLNHTAWGLDALSQIAETAWIQGIDLYSEAQARLVTALEFHAGLALGDEVPAWLCGGTLSATFNPVPEIAFNHYHNRVGIEMPRTYALIQQRRPQRASHFYGWSTLTSPGVP